VAAQLAASQEGLTSMELVSCLCDFEDDKLKPNKTVLRAKIQQHTSH
jgi:hypothetical protein